MKSKCFVILTVIFLLIIFSTQFKLINRPVIDNDEGIYLTSFLLVDKGFQAYKKTYFSQPPGFLLTVYPGFILFGKTLQAARLMISLWSLIGLLVVVWIGFELKNKWTGLLAASLLFLIPSYSNQSLTFQSDVLITTFSLISLAALLRFGKKFYLPWFVVSSFFLNLAFWTKFDITFFPSFFLALFLIYKDKKFFSKRTINLILIFFTVSLAFFIIFIFPFGIREVFNNSILLRFQAASISASFSLFYYLKKDLFLSVIILTSLFLGFLKNKNIRYPLIIIYVWSIFVLIIFYFYQPLFPHHLVIITVPLILLFSQLISLSFKDKLILEIITIIFLVLSLSNRIYLTAKTSVKLINDQQQNAVKLINKFTNIGDAVVSDEEILNGISGRLPPPELSDISQVRIKSNNLSPENFKNIINIYKPKLIIPWNGRLASIKNFKEVIKDYKIIYSNSDSTKIILLRQ
ncbi:MAG: glycosyltransferase family 39 protein [Patescibacteria group bacterium]|jgi:4-amino-4-deoxy-L-arabinose transferase-like glycosyltransferase